uniref:Uncharacterized protein n=1 Tax=Avena sativa TaxID=4498 RepID=A0ACD5WQD3_AVESA
MKKKRPTTTLVVSRLPNALDGRQLSGLWRQAIVNVHGSAAGPLPWVVLPDGCILTCAAGDMHYRPASIPDTATCVGSTDHWLALVSVNGKKSHSYTLYDPFFETTVPLPELDAVIDVVPKYFRISKVLMRSTPDDVVVFVSNHRKYPIILVRPGKGMWAPDPSTSSPFARVIDVAFLGDTLYGITLAEDLFALDIAFDAHGVPTVTGTRHVIKSSKGDDDCGSDGDEDYSESSADDSTENDYGLDDDDDDHDDNDTTDDDGDDTTDDDGDDTTDDDDDDMTDDDDDDDDDDDNNTPDDDDDDTPDDDDDDDGDMEDSDEEMLYGNTLGEDLFAFAIAFDAHESSTKDDDSDVWSTIKGNGDGGVDYSENGANDIGENDVDDDDDDDDDVDDDDDMEDDVEYNNKYEVSTKPKNLIVPIRYMVESRGKILMVRRKLQCPVHHRSCTRTVEVFEADMSACTWAPVENDLGGHTLFISKRFSKSVHAASESMKDACHFIDTRDTFSMGSNVTSALQCDSDYDMLVSCFPKEQCTWIFPQEQELL